MVVRAVRVSTARQMIPSYVLMPQCRAGGLSHGTKWLPLTIPPFLRMAFTKSSLVAAGVAAAPLFGPEIAMPSLSNSPISAHVTSVKMAIARLRGCVSLQPQKRAPALWILASSVTQLAWRA